MALTVALTDYHGTDLEIERALIENAGYRLKLLPTEADLLSCGKEIVALGVRHFRAGASLLNGLPNCRIVVRFGVGYDNIDVRAGTERGVLVAYVPDYCTNEVAEHALSAALLHVRGILTFRGLVCAGRWNAQAYQCETSSAVLLVILGVGRIGSLLAKKAAGVGFKVAAYDPFVSPAVFHECGALRLDSLESALAQADILSLHVPLTRAPAPHPTFHLIAAPELALMKSEALLINTSRGAVVDNAALCVALENGHPGSAFLDVLEAEPKQGQALNPGDFPVLDHLLKLDNVVVTPHCAFNSRQSVKRVKEMGTKEICRVLAGHWPRNVAWVNPDARQAYVDRFGKRNAGETT